MPARTKPFHEKTELTQEREISSHPWSMIFDSDSELLFRNASDSTLRAFLASSVHAERRSAGLLVHQDILKRQDGVYYYPKMSAFLRNSNRRRAKTENDEKSQETSENDDSPMANFHERGSRNEGSNSNHNLLNNFLVSSQLSG